jgi:cyanate permease
MRLLPGLRATLQPPIRMHQGGWDEALLFVGLPIALFAVLRWLAIRRERREAASTDAED